MEATFASLSTVSPALAVAVKFLLVFSAAILVWLVASIPAAIAYAALKTGLAKAAGYFSYLSKQLFEKTKFLWSVAVALRVSSIERLTLRYFYDKSESDLIHTLGQIGRETSSVSDKIQAAANSLEARLAPLKRELQLVVQAINPASSSISIPEIRELQDSSQLRRAAGLMLLIFVPLVVALVVVNTSLLTKFFESFFEEYISYQWGIKWATVVALMFSLLELALGISMYYLTRSTNQDSVMAPLAKGVVLLMVIGLAFIEAYLYLLLSADIARQTKDIAPNLPAELERIRHWWLAPLGFVIVVGLSFIGHALVDGLNRFIEARHLADLRAALTEFQRTLAQMDSIWDSLRTKVDGAKSALANFASDLGSGSPASVFQSVKEMIEKMSEAVQSLISARRNPISQVSNAEAASIFDFHVFLVVIFVVTLVAFCWLQVHFLGLIAGFKDVPWVIYLAVGLLESGAILAAGYKAYPSGTTIVEGGGVGNVLRSSRETLVNLACVAIVLSTVVLNFFVTKQESSFLWAAMFAVALIAIGVLTILGRTLPLLIFVLSTLVKQITSAAAGFLILLGYVIAWFVSIFLKLVIYFLYLLAFPMLFFFWKSQLAEPAVGDGL